jgi:hypothetical protein
MAINNIFAPINAAPESESNNKIIENDEVGFNFQTRDY